MAALCWVFSIVHRKNRPSHVCRMAPAGCRGSRNEMLSPTKGDTMGMARAGNRLPAFVIKHNIFSVYTAVPSKGESVMLIRSLSVDFDKKAGEPASTPGYRYKTLIFISFIYIWIHKINKIQHLILIYQRIISTPVQERWT